MGMILKDLFQLRSGVQNKENTNYRHEFWPIWAQFPEFLENQNCPEYAVFAKMRLV